MRKTLERVQATVEVVWEGIVMVSLEWRGEGRRVRGNEREDVRAGLGCGGVFWQVMEWLTQRGYISAKLIIQPFLVHCLHSSPLLEKNVSISSGN